MKPARIAVLLACLVMMPALVVGQAQQAAGPERGEPNVARSDMVKSFLALNVVLKKLDRHDKLVFIDIEEQMLGPDGQPDPEIFVPDGLHLSPKGYRSWTAAVMPFLRQ